MSPVFVLRFLYGSHIDDFCFHCLYCPVCFCCCFLLPFVSIRKTGAKHNLLLLFFRFCFVFVFVVVFVSVLCLSFSLCLLSMVSVCVCCLWFQFVFVVLFLRLFSFFHAIDDFVLNKKNEVVYVGESFSFCPLFKTVLTLTKKTGAKAKKTIDEYIDDNRRCFCHKISEKVRPCCPKLSGKVAQRRPCG